MTPTPRPLSGPFVWDGATLDADSSWRMAWSGDDIEDIERALEAALSRGATWRTVDRAAFPVSRVRDKLALAAEALEDGRGVVLISGLPVERYTAGELRLIWMGLGRHLGTPVSQDSDGQMMRPIRDEARALGERHGSLVDPADGSEFLSSKARTYGSGELRFHTDRTDVVGLLCVRRALAGGVSKIASTAAVHNRMLRRRPDLLELLYAPVHRSRLGEEAGGESMVYALPVFGLRDGKLTSHYSRTYIEAAQLLPDTPRLGSRQWEALDVLARTAEAVCHRMVLEPGDIQLLNNHVVYHARTPFTDSHDPRKKRLLLRLWLCMPGNRALPADHAVLWGNTEAGSLRGGIGVAAAPAAEPPRAQAPPA